jgi:hypothetical protein
MLTQVRRRRPAPAWILLAFAAALSEPLPALEAPRADGPAGAPVLTAQEIEDILAGSSYFGCGGGGSVAEALKIVRADLGAGLTFRLVQIEDMADEEYAAAAYAVGSLAPLSEDEIRRRAHLPRLEGAPAVAAFRLLERHLGRKLVAVIAGELGPGSVADSLSTAAHLSIAALDADAVGRSTPEVDQYSLLVAGIPVLPAAAVSPFGDQIFIESAAHPSREEEILRAISTVSEGNLGVADGAIPGRVARQPGVLVAGSLSRARRVGRAVREALAAGRDPIPALLEAGEGFRLFQGRVSGHQWKDEAGFLVGEVELAGLGRDQGSRYRIWFKNEHLMAWKDGAVSVTAPDLITLVETSTGRAIMNPEFERGLEVTVIGFRAAPLWRTPRGLEAFGPRHFGFDVPYVPIEERHPR